LIYIHIENNSFFLSVSAVHSIVYVKIILLMLTKRLAYQSTIPSHQLIINKNKIYLMKVTIIEPYFPICLFLMFVMFVLQIYQLLLNSYMMQ